MSIQDSIDQVFNWCDINHTVVNSIKTKSMTSATRQKHQLSPVPLDLVLLVAKIDQVSAHRILGLIQTINFVGTHIRIMSRKTSLPSVKT